MDEPFGALDEITRSKLNGDLTNGYLVHQSKWIEGSLFLYAVILQTTRIVAIAPLIILWLKNNTFAATKVGSINFCQLE